MKNRPKAQIILGVAAALVLIAAVAASAIFGAGKKQTAQAQTQTQDAAVPDSGETQVQMKAQPEESGQAEAQTETQTQDVAVAPDSEETQGQTEAQVPESAEAQTETEAQTQDVAVAPGSEETQGQTAAQVADSAEAQTETQTQKYEFRFGETVIAMGAEAAGIIEALGNPSYTFERDSCAYQGKNKVYTYAAFEVCTYPVNNKDCVESVYLFDPAAATPEGIRIGSSKKEVLDAYGDAYNADEAAFGTYAYSSGNTQLKIYTTNDIVDGIEYLVIP